jgi:threonine aldolase
LKSRNMLIQGVYNARLVTHHDVSSDDVVRFVAAVAEYFEGAKR